LATQKKTDKRDRIIQAAAAVFAEKGFAGTVVADIAGRAGIGKGTIYEYFRKKEDVFFAVFEWWMEEALGAGTAGVPDAGGRAADRLRSLCNSVMQMAVDMKPMYGLVLECWAASASSPLRERFRDAFRRAYGDFRGVVETIIQDGITRGEFDSTIDPRGVAASLFGSWDALGLQAWFDDAFDPQDAGNAFVEVVIRGMRA